MRTECRKGKEALSSTENPINIHLDINDDVEINVKLTRSKLIELCQDLFDKALSYVDRALKMPNISPKQIDHVILVGGSSRIPFIHEKLSEKFGKSKLKFDINPDEAVALGAAIYASSMQSNNTLLNIFSNIKNLFINDTQSSDIPGHNGDKIILSTPNSRQNEKVLFSMLYGEDPYEGKICLFNSSTFEVELIRKFSIWGYPSEVAIGNDKIFLIHGGFRKVFEIFNYETKQLTKGPDPPEWRPFATVAYYKNKLYYIGGRYSYNDHMSYVNILVNEKWQRGPDFPIEVTFARHSICNDKLYIISKNAVFQLSDDEREWIEVGKMEEERWGPAVASPNGKIYITGGTYDAFNSCLCFDPSQPFDSRFTTIANMDFNRYWHSLVVTNGKLYAIGGYQEKSASKLCKSVEEYDPATNRWRIVGGI